MNYETIVVSIIVVALIYFVTTIIIREIGELVMRISDSTFHKASEVAGVISALLYLQFLLGDKWHMQEIIGVLILVTLFVMTHFVYKLDWKESSIMALCCISAYAVLLLIIGAVYYLLQPLWG